MQDSLTARQTQILKSVVEEYIEIAGPIGSQILEKKHDLGISSATIRNEMVALEKIGFLKQPHASAGRVPTPKAMKFFISQLMDEKQMSLADEVKVKEEVWDVRANVDKLMSEITQALAERTGSLSVAALDDGRTWHAGLAHVFSFPEFADMAMCVSVFAFLEETQKLKELFFERFTGTSPVEVLFGEDLNWPEFELVGVVATRFVIEGKRGALAVVGPSRIEYPIVIPMLRYFGSLIDEIANT